MNTSNLNCVQYINNGSEVAHNGLANGIVMDHDIYNDNSCAVNTLEIVEQPVSRFRFRYESEVGSHGSLMGVSSTKRIKCFPKVRVAGGYIGGVRIRVSLYTATDEPVRHVHKLQGRNCTDDGVCEVLASITEECDVVEFPGVYIGHVSGKQIKSTLEQRYLQDTLKLREMLHMNGLGDGCLTNADKESATLNATRDSIMMKKQLNSVVLQFEAEAYLDGQREYVKLAEPVYSNIICNQKSPATNALKICRVDRTAGSVKGDDEMFLLVEKVEKKNIKVRFFEMADDNEWQAYGEFNDFDVHHQYAIVLRTPPYKDMNIQNPVKVFMELYRPTDGATSDPIPYTYFPLQDEVGIKRKRQRTVDCPSDTSQSGACAQNAPQRLADKKPVGLQLQIPDPVDRVNDPLLTSHVLDDAVSLIEEHDRPDDLMLYGRQQAQMTLSALNAGMDVVDGINLISNQPAQNMPSTSSQKMSSLPFDLSELLNTNTVGAEELSFSSNSFDDSLLVDSDGKKPSPKQQKNSESGGGGAATASTYLNNSLVSRGYTGNNRGETNDSEYMMTGGQSNFGSSVQDQQPQSSGNELVYRLTIQTLNALQNYARTGEIKHILTTMRHLTAVPDENGDNAIHLSVIHTQVEAVTELVEVGAMVPDLDPLNMFNELIQTPLHIAVHVNRPEIVESLVKSGANVNLLDRHGNSAIHIAANHSKPSVLRILVNKQYYENDHEDSFPKLNGYNYSGYTPLHLAVLSNSLECVRTLCESGCNLNVTEGMSGKTALHLAVEKSCKDIVTYLLDQKTIDVDSQSFNGSTALHLASSLNLPEIVKLLVAADADPFIENCERYKEDESAEEDEDEKSGMLSAAAKLDHSGKSDSDEEDVARGCNSFDMARDNENILAILNSLKFGSTEASDILKSQMSPTSTTEDHKQGYCGDSGFPETEPEIFISQDIKVEENVLEQKKSAPMALDSGIIEDDSGIATYDSCDSLCPEICDKLAKILDQPGEINWRTLSKVLDLDHLDCVLEGADSPTKSLLGHVKGVQDLIGGLRQIGLEKAVELFESRETGLPESSVDMVDKLQCLKLST